MAIIYSVANSVANDTLIDIKLFILIIIVDNNSFLTASECNYNYIYFIRK